MRATSNADRQKGGELVMEQDGPCQGPLLGLVEMWPKSLLVSPELVAITGNSALSPCSTFKPPRAAVKQCREMLV